MFDVQAEAVVKAHIEVAHPDQRKQCDQVSAPVRKEQLETRNHQEDGGKVVAEAVFTGEQVEKFALHHVPGILASDAAIFLHLPEDCLVSDGPCDRGDGQRQSDQREEL